MSWVKILLIKTKFNILTTKVNSLEKKISDFSTSNKIQHKQTKLGEKSWICSE